MTRSSLRERLERLGPVRAVAQVDSGSPLTLVLRLRLGGETPRTVAAAEALAARGVSLLKAKRAMDTLLDAGEVVVRAPTVESASKLAAELGDAGIAMAVVPPPQTIDVRALRERLGQTREQFALRYGLDVEAVRNWERIAGGRAPDLAASRFLQAIARDPGAVGGLIEIDPAEVEPRGSR